MPSAAEPAAPRQLGHNDFGRTAGLEIALTIRETNDRIGIGNIEPLGVLAAGVEGDAEWLFQVGCERLLLNGLAAGGEPAQDAQLPGLALGHEEIAVRSGANEPRIGEPIRIETDRESRGRFGQSVVRT